MNRLLASLFRRRASAIVSSLSWLLSVGRTPFEVFDATDVPSSEGSYALAPDPRGARESPRGEESFDEASDGVSDPVGDCVGSSIEAELGDIFVISLVFKPDVLSLMMAFSFPAGHH